MSASRLTPRRAELDPVAGDGRQLSDDAWLFVLASVAGFGAGQPVDVSIQTVTALVAALEDGLTIRGLTVNFAAKVGP